MTSTEDTVWRPTADRIEQANVTHLMRRLGYAVSATNPPALEAEARGFVRRSGEEFEWFWEAALTDIGIAWDRPYSRLLDASAGPEMADWFVGGRTNIVTNCVDRHAYGPLADKTALVAEAECGLSKPLTPCFSEALPPGVVRWRE